MKIHNINNYINYNSNAKPTKNEEPIKSKNYDVIELSKDKQNINKNLEKLKNAYVSEINKDTDAKKIEKIKESIRSNTYKPDIDEIVKRLLDK